MKKKKAYPKEPARADGQTRKKRRPGWKPYDYEAVYPQPVPGLPEDTIRKLIDQQRLAVYATKRIKAGTQMDVEIYPEFTRLPSWADKSVDREAQRRAQTDLNRKNSRKQCVRLINENFGPADYWLTLTYYDRCLPTDREQAKKDFRNWIARVNRRRKRAGLENAKYVRVIEWSNRGHRVRCHIHVVIDGGLPVEELLALWPLGGRAKPARLQKDEQGLTGLALYITKPHAKADEDTKFEKNWAASRNLRKPKEYKNHRDFGRRTVEQIAACPAEHYRRMEKKCPGYWCEQIEARWNGHNGLFYITAAMREKAQPGDLITISGKQEALEFMPPQERARLRKLLAQHSMLECVEIQADPQGHEAAVLRPPGGKTIITVPARACIVAEKAERRKT